MRLYTKFEDLYIIKNAYTDRSFDDIGQKLNRPPFTVFYHTKLRFGYPRCDSHVHFKPDCEKCIKNRILWEKNANEKIENISYNNLNRPYYTKAEDHFIIDNAYGELSFTQISEALGRTLNSAHNRMKTQFGLPKCEIHEIFDNKCLKCKDSLEKWKISSKKKIYTMEYRSGSEYDLEKIIQERDQRRRKNFQKRTAKFKDYLPEDIYEEIIEFMILSVDLAKGRKLESVFIQVARLFITDYIRAIDLAEVIPYELLDFFYNHKPNHLIIKVAQPIYQELINPNYHPMHDLIQKTLKDIKNLAKIYPRNICNKMWVILSLINMQYGNEWANLAAIIDICKKKPNSIKITQFTLAEIFETTTVTLRARVKHFKSRNFPVDSFVFNEDMIKINERKIWDSIKGVYNTLVFKQILRHNPELFDVIYSYIFDLEKKFSKLNLRYQQILKELEESPNKEQFYLEISKNLSDRIKSNDRDLNRCISILGREIFSKLTEESQNYLQISYILLEAENHLLYSLGILQLCKIIELEITNRIFLPMIAKYKNNEIKLSFNRPFIYLLSEKEKKKIKNLENNYDIFCEMIINPRNITLGVFPQLIGRLIHPEKYKSYTYLFENIATYLETYITQEEVIMLKNFLNNKNNLLRLTPNENLGSLRNYVAHPFNKEFRIKINITKDIFENLFNILTYEYPKIIHILTKIPKKQNINAN